LQLFLNYKESNRSVFQSRTLIEYNILTHEHISSLPRIRMGITMADDSIGRKVDSLASSYENEQKKKDNPFLVF
jgi:hypothetical protein